MRAADTNVLVRFLLRDDEEQYLRVVEMMRSTEITATPTVILETEWVLRSVYRLLPAEVLRALRNLLALPRFHVEAEEAVARALRWFEQGMDFADALHLAAAKDCDGLATFDRDFIRTAARIGAGNVAEP